MFEGDPQEKIKRDLRRLADDVAQLREGMMNNSREGLEHMRDTAREQFDTARQEVQAKAKEVDTYVKANPWLAAGIAAAVGIVLGALLTHKKRR